MELWDGISPDDGGGGDSTDTTTSSSGGLSAGVIILIVLGVLVGLSVVYGLWKHQKNTGSWNPLAPTPEAQKLETGGTAAHSALDSALMGDTSAAQMPGGAQ